MFHRLLLGFITLFLGVAPGISAQPPTPDRVKTALQKATEYLVSISTEGGYLWRYSTDFKQRWGEDKATVSQIWVQPPGTPAVGLAFIDAYRATKDERHLAAAQAAAMALVRGQLESGGWTYLIDFNPKERAKYIYRVDPLPAKSPRQRNNTTTFDDNNTQSALQFLMTFLDVATNRPAAELKPVRDALEYGLKKMLAAQYPNGAWPQRHTDEPHSLANFPIHKASVPTQYPRTWPHPRYYIYYTLNDNTLRDCIVTMLQAYHRSGNTNFFKAALNGGEFLLRAQLPEPQPSWAQQYDFKTQPTWARAFEPPAVCSSESIGAMRMLVDLYLETGDARFLKPIPPFTAWLKRSQIGTNRWARYYELASNKPIYGDRDGNIHYHLEELSLERERGYAWQGEFGGTAALAYYETVQTKGRTQFLADQKAAATKPPSATAIDEILAKQNPDGSWTSTNGISMRVFITNMEQLSAYLQH